MNQWYLSRQGSSHGPYAEGQLLQMQLANQITNEDLFCLAGDSRWIPLSQALPYWQNNQSSVHGAALQPANAASYNASGFSGAGAPPPKRRKKHGCLISFLVFVLVIAVAIAAIVFTRKSDRVRVGRSQALTSESIGKRGGTIVIDKNGGDLSGMTLEIPGGAYDDERRFKISSRPVERHKLGSDVEILSPLISIDNGHDFSAEPMLLTIPIELEEGQFAMGFYYDRKTGDLEGIPFSELTSDSITLVTHHFSDVLIAAMDIQTLLDMNVDTQYRPGLDDWQFTNYGSYVAPDGHCAGQALTSMYYYTEQHRAKSQPRLYGRYDNNNYGISTPDFQFDDSWGYRYSSVAQAELVWDTGVLNWQIYIGDASDRYSLAAFAFSMHLSGEPQFVYVAGSGEDEHGVVNDYAHAIVAYRIENGKLYVADPNFPGKADRFISFTEEGNFEPYGSGDNAAQIEANGLFFYTRIRYLAKTSLINYSSLEKHYQKMVKGEVGSDYFPDYFIEYLSAVDPDSGEETWTALGEHLELSSEDTEKAGEKNRGKLVFRMTNTGDAEMIYTLFEDVEYIHWTYVSSNISSSGGDYIQTIELEPGIAHYGFKIEHFYDDNKHAYSDFYRVKVVFDQEAEISLTEDRYKTIAGQEIEFSAKVKDEPDEPVYVWDFGDGKDLIVTNEPTVQYTYDSSDHVVLSVTLKDEETDELMAVDQTSVEVMDLFGTWYLDYTIEESDMLDGFLTQIARIIGGFIVQLFELDLDPNELEVTLRGTVVNCVMEVFPPESGKEGDPVEIILMQLATNRDFVEPTDEIWEGTLSYDDEKIKIVISVDGESMKFEGTVGQGIMYGSMDAVIIKGSFQAQR